MIDQKMLGKCIKLHHHANYSHICSRLKEIHIKKLDKPIQRVSLWLIFTVQKTCKLKSSLSRQLSCGTAAAMYL